MKLSLVMPVYNMERYLHDCLDSLLKQTFSDWELICVNDGSTDGTKSILDDYAFRDSRIKPIHQKNAKVHAARNRALDVAKGDWVGFLDPDDMIAPRWLETAMSYVDDEVDVVRMSHVRGASCPDSFLLAGSDDVSMKKISSADVPRWGWKTFPASGFLWLCFIRRERIGALRFRPDINCKEDGVFLIEMIPRLRGAIQTDCKGYYYRTVQGSLSIRRHAAIQTEAFIRAYREIWERQNKWISDNGIADFVRHQLHKGAVTDICDWATRRNSEDLATEKGIRREYLALRQSGAIPNGWCGGRARFRIPFAIWERTGWITPMSITGKSFLFIGNILRGLGLRKR